MKIVSEILDELRQRTAEASPKEACGLLAGSDDTIAHAIALRNVAPNPETRYFASPQDLFQAFRELRASGRKMIGIYHSHPRSPAFPSRTDVDLACYPDAVYVIVSGIPGFEIRAFRIVNRQVVEEVLDPVDHLTTSNSK
ncbi:MAG: M67 family metallopeptidase [Acidobacteria bacterium]|nr:M67 family metallopeptidase [Acidobacteriota bacterium]